MAARESRSLGRLWEAQERRDRVLSAHPRLVELEQQVAQAVQLHLANQGSRQEVEKARERRSAYLKQSGLPLDYAEPRWSCARCRDEGYVDGRPCACLLQAELGGIISNSGLPKKLREQTFDRFDLKWYRNNEMTPIGITERRCAAEALATCRGFVAGVLEGRGRTGLFVSGNPGLGKTFLLSAVCNSLLEARVPTLYVVFCDLIAAIKETFSDVSSTTTESRIMSAAREAKVLVLDDLGAEQVTDFVINRLFDIVNFRCNHELPLVVSSNLSMQQIGQLYDDRIASRLWEMCEVVHLYGEDIRIQQKRQG